MNLRHRSAQDGCRPTPASYSVHCYRLLNNHAIQLVICRSCSDRQLQNTDPAGIFSPDHPPAPQPFCTKSVPRHYPAQRPGPWHMQSQDSAAHRNAPALRPCANIPRPWNNSDAHRCHLHTTFPACTNLPRFQYLYGSHFYDCRRLNLFVVCLVHGSQSRFRTDQSRDRKALLLMVRIPLKTGCSLQRNQ